jgi:hypothetical protein
MESRLIGTDRDYYRLTDKPEIIGSSVGVSGKLACDHEIWKIADVIVQLANSDEVPVRLILGVDAEERVQQAEAARASEAEKWRHLTVSTVLRMGASTADCIWNPRSHYRAETRNFRTVDPSKEVYSNPGFWGFDCAALSLTLDTAWAEPPAQRANRNGQQ